ncbi:uncharacterized protein ASPGLDRAFT_1001880 [Aspergillus glaucus CBS 516.65]|uniref:Uncharacterized protein n=1 Tax=Aspergillus glaucus CBS 516.65 TaxID=1160497 RepID=A0A1L9VVE5_ASPGL|nr:hypothetical protein ASPGLDRAFT_1001880 [Aspergillus glaucus CBS 516.65]OJJ87871.1 hypothetical protein ASPGLDRAFT_1001880 [Aspergillus glaucus CBS 516.65]
MTWNKYTIFASGIKHKHQPHTATVPHAATCSCPRQHKNTTIVNYGVLCSLYTVLEYYCIVLFLGVICNSMYLESTVYSAEYQAMLFYIHETIWHNIFPLPLLVHLLIESSIIHTQPAY